MPTYTFYHEPSDIEWDEMMSNDEREQYKMYMWALHF